jgi:hypothetical protein
MMQHVSQDGSPIGVQASNDVNIWSRNTTSAVTSISCVPLHWQIKVDILRLRTPCGTNKNENRPYHHQDEHRVVGGYHRSQSRLVKDVKRRQDDSEAVAQSET